MTLSATSLGNIRCKLHLIYGSLIYFGIRLIIMTAPMLPDSQIISIGAILWISLVLVGPILTKLAARRGHFIPMRPHHLPLAALYEVMGMGIAYILFMLLIYVVGTSFFTTIPTVLGILGFGILLSEIFRIRRSEKDDYYERMAPQIFGK